MAIRIEGPNDGEWRWTLDMVDRVNPSNVCAAASEAVASCDHGPIQLWLHDVDPLTHRELTGCGWQAHRDLWQLRRQLPADKSGIITRSFTDADISEFVVVNNRAFSWHPEQGGLTKADVHKSMAEPWFDPDGFRLLHIEGRLAGFCWTKVHQDHSPRLGEIYVIAIDPDFHGRGLGGPMTLAGLEWLSSIGLSTGMLYVESDNAPANAVYSRLGFVHHHTDRAYRLVKP